MAAIVSTGYVKAISPGNFFFTHGDGPISPMQTVQDTRRQRVGILKTKYVKWSALNEALGWERTNTRLSQIHSGTLRSDRGTPYTMGDETAREIEQKLNLPAGWMDTPPTYAELHGEEPDALTQAHTLLMAMEKDTQYQALRLLTALAEPPKANATSGQH